ncbi:M23 family metallopeptidase [Clostridium estertheticum]|uniref:M23 family metallopeptidase n=1 Tax=Clostridium estertheticum TaxID=238834 RepID=UPI002714B6D8|nr:M23 family metallopeptidase [Clostridium estertheticum]
MNALRRNKSVICVLLTTMILTTIIVYFNVYRFYGYKVSIGKNTITFVKSRAKFNKTYREFKSEVKSKYSNATTIEDFTLTKVKVNDADIFISGDELKKVMLKKFSEVVKYNNKSKLPLISVKEVDGGIIKVTTHKCASITSPSRGSISSEFGTRWGKMHEGIDIAANFGEAIDAALDGTITYSNWEEGYGNVIKINNGNGIETTYAHCSAIIVKKGDIVKKGMKIGEVGSTGHSTGPHLHFEVRVNGEPKNPEKYIR